MDLSIVVPIKNEALNIATLAVEIETAFESSSTEWECIWVDDGSTDHSLTELKRLHQENGRHRFLSLTRHYGKAAALHIGFTHAEGEILAALDGDGQNDPADIPILVKCLKKEKADMVNGVRRNRQDSLVRIITSRLANGFRNYMTHDTVTDVGCALRVFKKECVAGIPPFSGMQRFLPTLVQIWGYHRIVEKPVNHRPRKFGQAKYGIRNRLWVGLADTWAVRWMQRRLVFPRVKETAILGGEKKDRIFSQEMV